MFAYVFICPRAQAWHRVLLTGRIPGMFKGSTEHSLQVGLPQLVRMDGLLSPDELCFDVPAIPKGMLEKAKWYVEHQLKYIKPDKDNDGDTMFYVLAKDNPGKYTQITNQLLRCYNAAVRGEKDKAVKTLDYLRDVCFSLHVVMPAQEEWGVPKCEGNPAELECIGCKGFKHVGICSHVLACNHILKKFNVRYQLMELSKKKKKGVSGGYWKGVRPALTREEPEDSSDEEQQELLRLGEEGK